MTLSKEKGISYQEHIMHIMQWSNIELHVENIL